VDWFNRTGENPNANVVLELDIERLWDLLRAAVA
jgi:inosine-uridine nucleoside N-ribohydrolase